MLKEVGKFDKTAECLVCGKLFPRGALDLARHQTAVTLLHVVSEKKSASFPHSCKKCGVYFTRDEHLDLHKEFSSCNPKNLKAKLEKIDKTTKDVVIKSKPSKKHKAQEIFVIATICDISDFLTSLQRK